MDQCLTQKEAVKEILSHYGEEKQERQALQELLKLGTLLTARPDQRRQDYRERVMDELADCFIMLEQIKMMHQIDEVDLNDRIVYKLRRQLDRIEREEWKDEDNL